MFLSFSCHFNVMRRLISVLSFISIMFNIQAVEAQNQWPIYVLDGVCSFRIPTTLEIRHLDSPLARVMEKQKNKFLISFGTNLPNHELVFQPIGMNSSDKTTFNQAAALYARVLVDKFVSDFPSQEDIRTCPKEVLDELDKAWRIESETSMKALFKSNDFSWYSLKRVKVGTKWALLSTYRRGGLNGTVFVQEYKFFFKTYLLRFTLSYREKEKNIWMDDLSKVMSTLSFN